MYGCHNRAPFKETLKVQDGYFPSQADYRVHKLVEIKDPMTKTCNYTLTDLGKTDSKCNGCNWRKE